MKKLQEVTQLEVRIHTMNWLQVLVNKTDTNCQFLWSKWSDSCIKEIPICKLYVVPLVEPKHHLMNATNLIQEENEIQIQWILYQRRSEWRRDKKRKKISKKEIQRIQNIILNNRLDSRNLNSFRLRQPSLQPSLQLNYPKMKPNFICFL